MLSLVWLLILLIVLAFSSLVWGEDSRESIDSPEWERRRRWSEDNWR